MEWNKELWERFIKSGAPADYLEFCRAREADKKEKAVTAASHSNQSRV